MTVPVRSPEEAACRVVSRLMAGYGAEDVRVLDGVPEAVYWRTVERLGATGDLARVLRSGAP